MARRKSDDDGSGARVRSREPTMASEIVDGHESGSASRRGRRRHDSVYVVSLRNPSGDGRAGYYVGMTGLSPEERLLNHKAGRKAARVVRRHGERLVPKLYAHLDPMTFEEAAQMGEAARAGAARARITGVRGDVGRDACRGRSRVCERRGRTFEGTLEGGSSSSLRQERQSEASFEHRHAGQPHRVRRLLIQPAHDCPFRCGLSADSTLVPRMIGLDHIGLPDRKL
jgi:hypothetical protein